MRTESYAVEERYFRWLYSHIGALSDLNPAHSHWVLAEKLHRRIFEPILPNDENRADDGSDLRDDFCDEYGSWEDSRFIFEPCSVLEMLIALARRMDFLSENSPMDGTGVGRWFWRLMENVSLSHITDDLYGSGARLDSYIDDTIDTFLYRRYSATGSGGLFPLRAPNEDQRVMELWYQMNQYMIENA